MGVNKLAQVALLASTAFMGAANAQTFDERTVIERREAAMAHEAANQARAATFEPFMYDTGYEGPGKLLGTIIDNGRPAAVYGLAPGMASSGACIPLAPDKCATTVDFDSEKPGDDALRGLKTAEGEAALGRELIAARIKELVKRPQP